MYICRKSERSDKTYCKVVELRHIAQLESFDFYPHSTFVHTSFTTLVVFIHPVGLRGP